MDFINMSACAYSDWREGDFTEAVPSRDSVIAERSYNFIGISDSDIDADRGYMPDK